jgi:hypothetical protein
MPDTYWDCYAIDPSPDQEECMIMSQADETIPPEVQLAVDAVHIAKKELADFTAQRIKDLLTPRQHQAMMLHVKGLNGREIATALHITPAAVHFLLQGNPRQKNLGAFARIASIGLEVYTVILRKKLEDAKIYEKKTRQQYGYTSPVTTTSPNAGTDSNAGDTGSDPE